MSANSVIYDKLKQPQTQVNLPLPDLKNARIEWFDNSNPPPKNRTQYGFVLDINGSEIRYNINFLDNDDGSKLLESGLSCDVFDQNAQDRICNMLSYYNILSSRVDLSMSYGQFNVSSGKKHPTTGRALYDLVPDFRVFALIIRGSERPGAYLFYGDTVYPLETKCWQLPTRTLNKQMKWVARL